MTTLEKLWRAVLIKPLVAMCDCKLTYNLAAWTHLLGHETSFDLYSPLGSMSQKFTRAAPGAFFVSRLQNGRHTPTNCIILHGVLQGSDNISYLCRRITLIECSEASVRMTSRRMVWPLLKGLSGPTEVTTPSTSTSVASWVPQLSASTMVMGCNTKHSMIAHPMLSIIKQSAHPPVMKNTGSYRRICCS